MKMLGKIVVVLLVVMVMAAPAFAKKIKPPKNNCYNLEGSTAIAVISSKPSGLKATLGSDTFKYYHVQAFFIDGPPVPFVNGDVAVGPDGQVFIGSLTGSYLDTVNFWSYAGQLDPDGNLVSALYYQFTGVSFPLNEIDCKTVGPAPASELFGPASEIFEKEQGDDGSWK